MSDQLRIGVVGLGYWGPNLARNFHAMPETTLVSCCDESRQARERTLTVVPGTHTTDRIENLLEDVEKPLAQSVADAERAVDAAERSGRTLMVGHLLEYHPGVRKLKELADSGELGEIHYIYGNRLNLGKIRADENALWSLGAHDISVLLHLVDEEPHELAARGESYVRAGVEDVVFCFLRFPSGISAHLHLSWLDPHKERRFTVVGSKRMATFDDMVVEGKLTLYDKGFDEDARSYGEYITRSGDIFSPHVPNGEPLRLECEHFAASIRDGTTPRSDGRSGLRVVRVLEALQGELERSRRA